MRNIDTNHSGLAAWNLWLSNCWTMYRYDLKHYKEYEYKTHWGRRTWELIKALFLGWTPLMVRTEKQYNKNFNYYKAKLEAKRLLEEKIINQRFE